MEKYIIKTSETDSVSSLPSEQFLDVELKSTSKNLPFSDISETINQLDVYNKERKECTKYRLILTIVPYCSNVLFNSLTEIVNGEGSDNVKVITDLTNINGGPINDEKIIDNTIGINKPTRTQMISNTEYSSESHGAFDYHPGYDFFDNHLLRNKSFKLVNPLNTSSKNIKNASLVFNTLEDYARDRNGDIKKFNKRLSINSLNNEYGFNTNKHLYQIDDILKIEDSINQNLYEDNGWWGFTNNTSIDSKELSNRKWTSMDISKAINNKKACEFIDMFPDRTLFSFTPKFNKYTHENENNWNVAITYPYKNYYKHPISYGGTSYIRKTRSNNGLVKDEVVNENGKWTGLKIVQAFIGSGKIGGNNIVFRTYSRHGLKRGDAFYLYYTNAYKETEEYKKCDKFNKDYLDGSETYVESDKFYKVTSVGDLNKNNSEYYFYTSDFTLLKDIYTNYIEYCTSLHNSGRDSEIPFKAEYDKDDKNGIYDSYDDLKVDLLNKILKFTNFRVRRCVNGVKSKYYIRQFRKLPNLKSSTRDFNEEELTMKAKFDGSFDNFIRENANDPNIPNQQRGFSNETYQLAFSSSIYNDNITQITFTDGVDVHGLTDNLGRPLTEIYYTVVKNNAGNEVWYDGSEPIYSNKSLLEKYANKKDEFKEKYGVPFDGYKIEFSRCFGKVTSGLNLFTKDGDNENNIGPSRYWKMLSSVKHITNVINNVDNNPKEPISKDTETVNLEDDIKIGSSFFYGDLVEFNVNECEERVICDVMHRFNTAQRETTNNHFYSQFQYHEIVEDDYDPFPFEVTEFSAVTGIKDESDETPMTTDYSLRKPDYATITRPEGYYYKPHYKIQIGEFTNIRQASNFNLRIKSAKPVQRESMLIEVKTLLNHKLRVNDKIFICDDKTDTQYITKCVGVIDGTSFLMSPNYEISVLNGSNLEEMTYKRNIKDGVFGTENYANIGNVNIYNERLSWLEICDSLNGYSDSKLVLRTENKEIPSYATNIGDNQFIWRDFVRIGDNMAKNLPNQVFANGYFYIPNMINFYLKRQDPFGVNGLYFDGENKYPVFPNDPSGNKQPENNFLVKDSVSAC